MNVPGLKFHIHTPNKVFFLPFHMEVGRISSPLPSSFLTVKSHHGLNFLLQCISPKLYITTLYCILSPCLFNLHAEYIMRNARLDESQAGIKIMGEIPTTSEMQMILTLMAEREELKSLLMREKEDSEKAGLKLNIQKTKIMASGPITSWQIDGETMETMRDFIFLGSKITADDDCSHEIKRRLLLGRKAMTNLGRILKSKDITLLTKVHIVKAMVFLVV